VTTLSILMMGLSTSTGQELMKISSLQRVMPGTSVELMCEVNISEIQRMVAGDTFSIKWSLAEDGDTLALTEVNKGMEMLDEEVMEWVRMMTVRGEDVMQWNMIMDNVNMNHSGLYECQATVGQEVLATKHTLLVVLGEEGNDLHHTTFTFSKKGGVLSLDCSDLEGDGREATWTKPGSDKEIKHVYVDKEGSGVYYCAVKGNTHVSGLTQHLPEVRPRVRHVHTRLGLGARLECLVSAAPVPAVTWYRINDTGAEVIRSNENIEIIISDYTDGVITSSLVLESMTGSEAGEYVCSAGNIHGKVNATVDLMISEFPMTFINVSLLTIIIVVGINLILLIGLLIFIYNSRTTAIKK